HALSRKGAGNKTYDVQFPDGTTMRITATARRIFADLSEPRLLPLYQRCEPHLLPGMRVLIIEGGTGYPGAWAAGRGAPSGAVVLVDRDTESIAFAQKRYAGPNISFEVGGPESVTGETDGSFNAVFAVDAIGGGDQADAPLRELWRVVAPNGWLMAAWPAGDR